MIEELHINGASVSVNADPDESLLCVLRESAGLTGTKFGCGENQCSACTVLVDGTPRRTCTLPVASVVDRRITTIEGLSTDGKLHPVQQAFLDHDAMQCGYCTSGMIMGAVALLEQNPDPSTDEIAQSLDRHLCRCGAYHRIIAAIHDAARRIREAP